MYGEALAERADAVEKAARVEKARRVAVVAFHGHGHAATTAGADAGSGGVSPGPPSAVAADSASVAAAVDAVSDATEAGGVSPGPLKPARRWRGRRNRRRITMLDDDARSSTAGPWQRPLAACDLLAACMLGREDACFCSGNWSRMSVPSFV
jgi:hypothetical protein